MCHKKTIHLSFAFVALVLSGCFSTEPKADPTRFYTLSPMSFSEASDSRLQVVLSQVPYYLSGRKLAIRSGDYEVEYLEFHRWAEPLDVMLERRLQSELIAAGVSGAIEVIVARFEATTEGVVVLAAEWVSKEGTTFKASGTYTGEKPWRENDPAIDMVEALGALLDELAVSIRAEI